MKKYQLFFVLCGMLFVSARGMEVETMEVKKVKKVSLKDFGVSKEWQQLIDDSLPKELHPIIEKHFISSKKLWYKKAEFQHKDLVTSARYNKEETQVLTASGDETACIWDVATGNKKQQFQHDYWVKSARYNGDETQVLTASGDKTACIWDVATGNKKQQFEHGGWVMSARYNKDETQVLTASDDRTACIWDVATDNKKQQFQHNDFVYSARYNGDETQVLTASLDNTACIWQRYDDCTLGQMLLCKLLYTWLRVEKPSKTIDDPDQMLRTAAAICNVDYEELIKEWQTFPIPVQTAVWNEIRRLIVKYGKA